MLEAKLLEIRNFIDSMGDTREEEIMLNQLTAEKNNLKSYLIETNVKQIKIK